MKQDDDKNKTFVSHQKSKKISECKPKLVFSQENFEKFVLFTTQEFDELKERIDDLEYSIKHILLIFDDEQQDKENKCDCDQCRGY